MISSLWRTMNPNPRCVSPRVNNFDTIFRRTMAPDTSSQPCANVSAASTASPAIPKSPTTLRDSTLDEELIDPDAKLILSDFTQGIHERVTQT